MWHELIEIGTSGVVSRTAGTNSEPTRLPQSFPALSFHFGINVVNGESVRSSPLNLSSTRSQAHMSVALPALDPSFSSAGHSILCGTAPSEERMRTSGTAPCEQRMT